MKDFHFSTEVRVRLAETDHYGIAFHGWFFTYMDVGRMDYVRNLGLMGDVRPKDDFSNAVVRSCCDFKSPARFDDELVVHVRISEIGRTSLTFQFVIVHKRENREVARGDSVHVFLDYDTFTPIPVPDEFRRRVREFEGGSLKERIERPGLE
jgi:acyl-CoA thioester hydrolase